MLRPLHVPGHVPVGIRAMDDRKALRLRFASFELDAGNARLMRDGQPVALTPKAFDVLCALARTPGQLLSKGELLDAVWGHQHVSESVLKTTISELRAALADDARQPRYIETAPRRGYRFIGTAGEAAKPYEPPPALSVTAESAPPMTGRQSALQTLRDCWSRALAGRRQVVWVVGEAGVGKTTLIRNFLSEIDPMLWTHGQCVEQHGAGEPCMPVLEALAELCRRDPQLPAQLRMGAPTWLMQLPWFCSETDRAALRQELAGAGPERMARELREITDVYTQNRPLLLVTEDLHWSDQATLRLMDYLARSRQPSRAMWLASFRLAEVVSDDHPLKALRHELRLHDLVTEIALDTFSEREVGDYLARRLPDTPIDEEFARSLHRHTDGLPLFVASVVDDLDAQGTLRAAAAASNGGIGGTLEVPENLAGVIGRQFARLPADARSVLEAASICGVEFRLRAVADALGCEVSQVEAVCDELARRKQWLDALSFTRLGDGSLDARYMFRHALYRQVLYQGIGALARARLHRRVAESMLESRDAGVLVTAAELATHYERSHDIALALRHYADAADSALRHFAPDEALALTAHALALLPQCPKGPERDACELALVNSRGVAASQLHGVGAAETHAAFDRARVLAEQLPAGPARASELTGMGWVHFTRGEYREARTLAERVHRLAQSSGDPLLLMGACNLLGTSMAAMGELADARSLLEQGLQIGVEHRARIGNTPFVIDPEVSLRANLGPLLSHLGLVDQAQAHLDAALLRARELGDPMSEMMALWNAGILAWRLAQPARALEISEALQATVADHGLAQGEGPALWLRGWAIANLGDPQTGYALIVRGLDHHARRGMLASATDAMVSAADALLLVGRWSEARTRIDDALQLTQRTGERIYLPDLLIAKARVLRSESDRKGEREVLRAALDEARLQGALWMELSALVALCAEDARPRDRAALVDACARLQEGGESPLANKARELLK